MFGRCLLLSLALLPCIATLIPTLAAQTPASHPLPSLQTMIDHETFLLEFAGGGSPLSPAERQQAAQIVREALNDPAAHWLQVAAREAQSVAVIQSHDPKVVGAMWDGTRYNYAFDTGEGPLQRWFLIEKHIIEAHDPVLFADAPHKRIVTAHMLDALRKSAAFAASMYNVPPPAQDFGSLVRGDLPQIPSVDPDIADGLAHIVRYQPYILPYFASLSPASRTNFFAKSKSSFNHLDDHAIEQWEIAETGAMLSRFAVRQTGQSASMQSLTYGMQMQYNTMGNAARGLSAACNPTLSPSARAQNNCNAPIPVPGLP